MRTLLSNSFQATGGTQPGTSGPVYVGAIVLFLFVLSLFLTKGPVRAWIIAATIFSVLLSWGRNFMPLTNFFLDYFPGYNKFRTVSMILVIAGFTIPLLASIGLNKIFSEEIDKVVWKKAMIWSVALTAGISLVFFLIPGLSGSFVSASDSQMPRVDPKWAGIRSHIFSQVRCTPGHSR